MTWGTRRPLPSRRHGTTIKVAHHLVPASQSFLVTIGHYEDWSPGEIFINTEMKHGTDADTNVSDFAVTVSLALQHGCPLDRIIDAMKHNPNGDPTGLFAHILDKVRIEENRAKRERQR
jgi:hypothetical protein